MFFTAHTTAQEQCSGVVGYDLLMSRYAGSKSEFLKDAPLGLAVVEVCIVFRDTVYELQVDMSSHEGEDGIYWLAGDTEDRELVGGSMEFMNSSTVPLTWEALVPHLCARFNLDQEAVWAEGVDLTAYWDAHDDEYLKVPRTEDRARYSLAKLHRPQFC